MNHKKSLQELTFKDNFMFGAVLLDPENCRGDISLVPKEPMMKKYQKS